MSFENSYLLSLFNVDVKPQVQRSTRRDLRKAVEAIAKLMISNGMSADAGAVFPPELIAFLKSDKGIMEYPIPKGEDLRIIRLDTVIKKVGLSRSTIYNLIKKGDFPDRVGLGQRSMGFYEHEIDDWILKLGRST